jgi:sec-independent protein translocase protein TatA
MPFSVGPMELVIVLVLALLILGPKRLPEAGKSLGRGMREFKNSIAGMSGDDDEDEKASLTASTPVKASTPVDAK